MHHILELVVGQLLASFNQVLYENCHMDVIAQQGLVCARAFVVVQQWIFFQFGAVARCKWYGMDLSAECGRSHVEHWGLFQLGAVVYSKWYGMVRSAECDSSQLHALSQGKIRNLSGVSLDCARKAYMQLAYSCAAQVVISCTSYCMDLSALCNDSQLN